jgi:hypothetical protein
MKIFAMNDTDWIAGNSLEDCTDYYKNLYVGDEQEVVDARELTEDDLDSLTYFDSDEDVSRSFREELERLIANQASFPRFFATTEC